MSRLNCHWVTEDKVVHGIVSLNPLSTHTNCCHGLRSLPVNQCRSRSDCFCRSSDLGPKCFLLHLQMPNFYQINAADGIVRCILADCLQMLSTDQKVAASKKGLSTPCTQYLAQMLLRGTFGKFLAWSFTSVTNSQTLSCLVSF